MFVDSMPCDVCIHCANEPICPLVVDGFQSECDIFASFFVFKEDDFDEV